MYHDRDLSDFSMMDLFKTEVETHASTINEGLLSLENDPDNKEQIESLMRAAHSIKGGARIVELDEIVKLAHKMEDCFVSAQNHEISLESEKIDVLFKTVDLVARVIETDEEEMEAWISEQKPEIDSLLNSMTNILSGQPLPKKPSLKETPVAEAEKKAKKDKEKPQIPEPEQSVPTEEKEKPEAVSSTETPSAEGLGVVSEETKATDSFVPGSVPSVSGKTEKETVVSPPPEPADTSPASLVSETKPGVRKSSEKERMVRVSASKIDRLMGLAGEVVVTGKWLPSFNNSLMDQKKLYNELFNLLDRMQRARNREKELDTLRNLTAHVREKVKELNVDLMEKLNQIDMYTTKTENLSDRLYHEVIGIQMSPFSDGIKGFPRLVRDLSRELGKKARLEIIGESTEVDRDILEKLEAPLNHLIRNSLDHGIESPEDRIAAGKPETGTIRLEAVHRSGMLMITLSDDGRGIDLDELREKILYKGLATGEMVNKLTEPELMEFLFLSGFSTTDNITEISGRGVGLDVVHNMVHSVGGVVRASSKPNDGTSFTLELPLTLSVIPTFLVEIGEEPYAFPLARIDRCLSLDTRKIETVEDRQYFKIDNKNISIVDVHDVLDMEKSEETPDFFPIVVISDRMHSYGLVVDQFLGESDLVVRPLDPRLGKVSDISAVSVMLDGTPVLIFDVEDLVRSIDNLLSGRKRFQKLGRGEEKAAQKKGKNILVVDDSITVREMERKLLENKGYHVEVAVDGMDGWNMLRLGNYDMVISDIDMPRMNGFELISLMKQHAKLKELPVMIVSYKNKEEDRLRGMEVGANYYLTKSSFQDNSFIDAVVDLIGEA